MKANNSLSNVVQLWSCIFLRIGCIDSTCAGEMLQVAIVNCILVTFELSTSYLAVNSLVF